MASIISCRKLVCGYLKTPVLNNIDLDVKAGEMVGIIGPNGCGKTTLIKSLSGFLKPISGEILIHGKSIKNCSSSFISQKVAVVNQSMTPLSMSVSDYVTMGRLAFFKKFQFFETSKDRKVVENNLKLTDSFKNKDKMLNELSGGERQLAQIARALTQQPDIILLDEPTSHLDITHQIRILNLVRKLNHELGLTVIMVIHDLNLAAEYCDRLVMIDNGNIYKDGTTENVLTEESLLNVYKTKVSVNKNPLSGKPLIIPHTEMLSV